MHISLGGREIGQSRSQCMDTLKRLGLHIPVNSGHN